MSEQMAVQQAFWNRWNATTRETRLSEISLDQKEVVLRWLREAGRTDLEIIEVGCGAGWLCGALRAFGSVTATDLSDEVLSRARAELPDVTFVAGDFMALDFPAERFDAVITLEVLSHVADQEAFVDKLARLLKPGGLLILATQNRPVLEKYNNIPAPQPGQLRRWVDRVELQRLLSARFKVREISSITLNANKGPMRLVAGRSAKRMIRMVSGRSLERALARAGLGWTLMALAEKPVETA
jgi:2-polyprenyl-3-methyl-5-hydroxy-6-metoxy-1,4-benzoquinol methylase